MSLEIIPSISIITSEVGFDLIYFFPIGIIMFDSGKSLYLLGDLGEYHQHLSSQGIYTILPEEVLRKVAYFES